MTISINKQVSNCRQCRHLGHSGRFTPGGARPICEHSDAPRMAQGQTSLETSPQKEVVADLKWAAMEKPWFPYKEAAENIHERSHWVWRVVDKKNEPPNWCPLRHGFEY